MYWASVGGAPFQNTGTGTERRFYIQAEEVDWNYAPEGRNEILGTPFSEDDEVFVGGKPGFVGSTYLKCIYRCA